LGTLYSRLEHNRLEHNTLEHSTQKKNTRDHQPPLVKFPDSNEAGFFREQKS
jgi:hypothetical protein